MKSQLLKGEKVMEVLKGEWKNELNMFAVAEYLKLLFSKERLKASIHN